MKSPKEVLEYYYSSVVIIKVPTKADYMRVDDQATKLYKLIAEKCKESFEFKKKTRMLFNTEKLPMYVSAAFDYFSKSLKEPFDFVTAARRFLPPPLDFGEHMLNFIMLTYNRWEYEKDKETVQSLFAQLVRPIASCIIMAATRAKIPGTTNSKISIFSH